MFVDLISFHIYLFLPLPNSYNAHCLCHSLFHLTVHHLLLFSNAFISHSLVLSIASFFLKSRGSDRYFLSSLRCRTSGILQALSKYLGFLWSCDVKRNTYHLMFVTTRTLITLRLWEVILPGPRQDCSFIEQTVTENLLCGRYHCKCWEESWRRWLSEETDP